MHAGSQRARHPNGDRELASCAVAALHREPHPDALTPAYAPRPARADQNVLLEAGSRVNADRGALHVQQGRVAMEDALKASTHPHDFKLLVSSDGMRSSSAESVFSGDEDEQADAPVEANGAQPSVTGAPGA